MNTINAKFIEQLELIEPDLKDTEADFKWASSSVKKDQFRIDKNNASKIVLRVGRAMLAIKNTKQNLELYKDALKKAHRTLPAGAYKRGGMGHKYPKFSSGMTTAEYCIKFQALNNDVGAHVLPIDFDALGDRPAALYENGALDFDVIEESIEAIEVATVEKMDADRAAQDVAQVVSNAVAAIAIDEALQPSESPALSNLDKFLAVQKEKMTCVRYAQTKRLMNTRVKYDGEIMQAHAWIELLIQSEGCKTVVKQENKLQDMTRMQSRRANNEEQNAHEKRVKLAGTKSVYYAQDEAGSMAELKFTEYLYAQFLEALQPSDALELATCEAGENEAQAPSIGSTTGNTPAWSAMAGDVPCSPIKTGFGDAQKPAFSGGFEGENDKNVPDTPPMESGATPAPRPVESAYYLPANRAGNDWNGYMAADFTPDARQKIVIDAVTIALNEKLYYTADVLARCIEILKIDADTASMNYKMRVEGGLVGMDVYYARKHLEAKLEREASAIIHAEMDIRTGDMLGILVFTDYKRTTGATVTEVSSNGFSFTGKRGSYTVTGTGTADQIKNAIDRAFTTGKRKTDYPSFLVAQAKRQLPTPPAVESQPVVGAPPAGTEAHQAKDVLKRADIVQRAEAAKRNASPAESEFRAVFNQLSDAKVEGLQLKDRCRNARAWVSRQKTHGAIDEVVYQKWIDLINDIYTEPVQDVPPVEIQRQMDDELTYASQRTYSPSYLGSYRGEELQAYFAANEGIKEAHCVALRQAWADSEPSIQDVPAVATETAAPKNQQVKSKSGKWAAILFIDAGAFVLLFNQPGNPGAALRYPTASDRMKALQAMARAADAPDDTTTDGQKRTESTGITPTTPVAVSSAASTTPPAVSSAHPRNIIPANGLHIVDDAFEAWTFPHKDRFGFVIYLGKSAKPWKYYGYPTEAKRDAGFERCATEARDIAASKAKTKAETKARIDAGHGLQVGDVVRSSWGYDQTNVSHYQIVNIIGKRTVEVRKLAEHDDATGSMSGRCSPVWGEFVGDVKRCMVDQFGSVNVMGRDFGRASKIEPLTVVYGVRCYAASYYSTYA